MSFVSLSGSLLDLNVWTLGQAQVATTIQLKSISENVFGHISAQDALILIPKKILETRLNLRLNAASPIPLAVVVKK